jgi:hypothetical protein
LHIEHELAGKTTDAINRGFSKQSFCYDELDEHNLVLQDLRRQVYSHVDRFIKPGSHILELNAGTGIDAVHFASQDHRVHATDLADGMVAEIRKKMNTPMIRERLTCQQVSFTDLNQLSEKNFDYVFSNFGGLNCIRDLTLVTRHLPGLLNYGAYVTFVIMPPLSPWEWGLIFKGRWRNAVRRFNKGGAAAHVEGEHFQTYYHSCSQVRKSFPASFRLMACEGLAVTSPPPHRYDIPVRSPRLYKLLRHIDGIVKDRYPFNRCGDHIIVTLRYLPSKPSSQ